MIILLNCSLKSKNGNSKYFLEQLKTCCHGECEEKDIKHVLKDMDGFVQELKKAEALVLGAPLYVDGMPAQVMRFMEELYEQYQGQFPNLHVYVVSNLGFYESTQIRVLLDITKNWCTKMQIVYGGGLAIGAGGMMRAFKSIPLKKGPNKAMGEGMEKLANAIEEKKVLGNLYVDPTGVPRFVYILAAHQMFRREGKQNGVKVD